MSYQASEKLQKLQSKYTIEGGEWTEEIAEQELVLYYLTPEDSVLEIGGNIGRVSLIISTIVPGERHIVLESNKDYAITLQKNRDRNHASFKIDEGALSSISKNCLDNKGSPPEAINDFNSFNLFKILFHCSFVFQ